MNQQNKKNINPKNTNSRNEKSYWGVLCRSCPYIHPVCEADAAGETLDVHEFTVICPLLWREIKYGRADLRRFTPIEPLHDFTPHQLFE